MHYTDTHEWLSLEGNKGTVGITTYAQEELGAIVFVQLPKVGQKVTAGEEVCVLESTKAAADVYAPVSGTIVAVNEEIVKFPGKINQSAETTGWLFQLTISNLAEIENLLTLAEYRAILE
jgi:glycine cleavage system H protein